MEIETNVHIGRYDNTAETLHCKVVGKPSWVPITPSRVTRGNCATSTESRLWLWVVTQLWVILQMIGKTRGGAAHTNNGFEFYCKEPLLCVRIIKAIINSICVLAMNFKSVRKIIWILKYVHKHILKIVYNCKEDNK